LLFPGQLLFKLTDLSLELLPFFGLLLRLLFVLLYYLEKVVNLLLGLRNMLVPVPGQLLHLFLGLFLTIFQPSISLLQLTNDLILLLQLKMDSLLITLNGTLLLRG